MATTTDEPCGAFYDTVALDPPAIPGRRTWQPYRVLVLRPRLRAPAAIAVFCVAACSGADEPTPATVTSPPHGRTPTPTTPACDQPCYADVESVGRLTADVVVEVSGMAASHRTPGVYYVVGDDPGTSEIAAVREDGALVARLEIEGMAARNAEALAVGPCEAGDPRTCLYVGDIGNHVEHPEVFVYRVLEPDLGTPPPESLPAEALTFRYLDQRPDAEALLVDDHGRPLIISKASFESGVTGPTYLYRGPSGGGTLEQLGRIDLPEPENADFADLVGNVVTDASAVDGAVLLRTYDEVLEYRSGPAGADLAGFASWPVRRVPAPDQLQSETVAYRVDGCGFLTTSEITGGIGAVNCSTQM